MKDFTGKVAVVTGGGSGIGFAMAERFGREGMKVVIADVEPKALDRARAVLEEKGIEAITVRTNVARAEEVEALAAAAYERFGAVHVLANNAGVSGDLGPAWEQPLASWEWVLGVNLWGIVHGIRAFVPRMLESGMHGHILNTASMSGFLPGPLQAPYNASKHAVVGISETLHHDLALRGARIRVSVLSPGYVKTRIVSSARNRPEDLAVPKRETTPEEDAFLQSKGKLFATAMDPADVAAAVVEGIRAHRFYIFPDADWTECIETHAARIARGEDPVDDVPSKVRAQG
jgi:NAD(P)-dependent dehydrogenase (short-subunit alcohol dehydrogenase family)